MKTMQLTLEVPNTLGYRLKSIPNLNEFIVKVLSQSLSIPKSIPKSDVWNEFLSNIDQHAVETGISDLAENPDHYLYQKPIRNLFS